MVTAATDPVFVVLVDGEVAELSTGRRLRLPVRYIDSSSFSVE